MGRLAGYLLNPAKRSVGKMAGRGKGAYSPHAIDFSISSQLIEPLQLLLKWMFSQIGKEGLEPACCFVRIGGDGTLAATGIWKMDGVEMGR